MNLQAEYQAKLITAEAAMQFIPKRGNISIGMAMSEPPLLLQALEKKAHARLSEAIEALNIYYMHSGHASQNTIFKYENTRIFKPHPFFFGKTERELLEKERINQEKVLYFTPANFSRVPELIADIGIDAFLVMVSPMDKSGLFSCGTNCDYTIPIARISKNLIVEVNSNMPRVFGDSCLHLSEIKAIVENNQPLPEISARPGTPLDHQISEHLLNLIPDHATLQMGIGGVPNAICEKLRNHHGLGIHTELITFGLVDLIESGAVTNKYKNINKYKNVYTLAQGDKKVYDFLNNNAIMEIYPASYVNNPNVISQNDNVISINGFLQIDLTGQVNSEGFAGRQYSAPGGQLDFVRGAQLSKNGKSILAAYSTAQNGALSRIVPNLDGPVTTPRADVHYVATEYGVVNLRGKSISERALALIEIAHPKFQETLLNAAKEMRYV